MGRLVFQPGYGCGVENDLTVVRQGKRSSLVRRLHYPAFEYVLEASRALLLVSSGV